MTNKVVVYGASDDLIEIEGDIEEEFSAYLDDDEPFYVAFSEGSLLRITYDGMWNIHVLHTGFGTVVDKHEATDEDTDYSDRVTLSNELPFQFVVGGKAKQVS